MRTKVYVILCLAFVTFFCGCTKFTVENRGYAKSVTFTKDGGEQVLSGDDHFAYICIGDAEGNEVSSEEIDGAHVVKYGWLTAKSVVGSNEVILTAAPSDVKSRKLYVYGYFGKEYAEIKVIQE